MMFDPAALTPRAAAWHVAVMSPSALVDRLLVDLEIRMVRIEEKVDRLLARAAREERIMSALQDSIDTLTQQVTQQTTVEQSAITLINGIAAQLAALQSSTVDADAAVAIGKLRDQFAASATALTSAVTANTPPVVTPTPTPAPTAG
jgi:small-conductance mechanosensitive channel